MRPTKNRKRTDPRYFLHEKEEKYHAPEALELRRQIARLLGVEVPGERLPTDPGYRWADLAKTLSNEVFKHAEKFWLGSGALEGYLMREDNPVDLECYFNKVSQLKPIATLGNLKDGLDNIDFDPNLSEKSAEYDAPFKAHIKANLGTIKKVLVATAKHPKKKLKLYPIAIKIADQCVKRGDVARPGLPYDDDDDLQV